MGKSHGNNMQWIPTISSQQSTSQNNIPEWLTAASQRGVGAATDLLNNPGQAYTGELVPGMNATQNAVGNAYINSVGAYQPYYNAAAQYTQNSTGSAPNVTPMTFANGLSGGNQQSSPQAMEGSPGVSTPYTGKFGGTATGAPDLPSGGGIPLPGPDGRIQTSPSANYGGNPSMPQQSQGGISQYMNPYINNVVNSVNALSNQNLNNALTQTGDQAISAHAFGGSRHGVQEGVATAQNNLNTNNLLANLLSSGYTQATGLMGQDISNNLQSQLANQNNANNMYNRMQSAGGQMANIGTANRAANVSDLGNVMQYGNQQQQTQAGQDQAAYNEYLRMQNMPYQALQAYNQTIQGAPRSTSSSTSSSGQSYQQQQMPTSNPLMTGLGLAAGVGSMFIPGGQGLGLGLLGNSLGGLFGGGNSNPYAMVPTANASGGFTQNGQLMNPGGGRIVNGQVVF